MVMLMSSWGDVPVSTSTVARDRRAASYAAMLDAHDDDAHDDAVDLPEWWVNAFAQDSF